VKTVDGLQEQIKTQRQNQKEMLEMKNTITEMKNAFDRLNSSLNLLRKEL
jgi:hypothetical protein